VNVSSLFHTHNAPSAILAPDVAVAGETSPSTNPRKSFFRRWSEKTRIRPFNPLSPPSPGVEESSKEELPDWRTCAFIPNRILQGIPTAPHLLMKKSILTSPSGQIQFCSEAAKALSNPIFPIPKTSFPFFQNAFPILTSGK